MEKKVGVGVAAACAAAVCTMTTPMIRQWMTQHRRLMKAAAIVKEMEEEFATPLSNLQKVAEDMTAQMQAGLASEGGSNLKMLNTFVDNLPTGDEEGLFYALDLGGTNFRVLRLKLGGKEKRIVTQEFEKGLIPLEWMTGTAEQLFDHIADALSKFVATEGEGLHPAPHKQRELGFTFSFPVEQTSISSGKLIKWTKCFQIDEMVGEDVTVELKRAMDKKGLDMRVTALINDTVGALALGRYSNPDVVAAVILGTGTNAAYVEHREVPKWHGILPKSTNTVINTEWGNFNSPHLPVTIYDEALDKESKNYREQIYEKMISGKYLGDIVRRMLCRIAEESGLFGDTVPPKLKIMHSLGTPDMEVIHHDKTPDLEIVAATLEQALGISGTSLKARRLVIKVCDIVATRGARMSAAGIIGISNNLGDDTSGDKKSPKVIAVEGGMFEKYTKFREALECALDELLRAQVGDAIVLEPLSDGSGIGAALLAASHSQYLEPR